MTNRKKTKWVFYFLIGIFIFFSFLIIFQTKFHQLGSTGKISPYYQSEIIKLASTSLQTNDVPVGAILVYDDSIIGRGFNTVYGYNNPAGHAEINAINEAIVKLGVPAFNELNRRHLKLYSSFEPCEMCKGALLHYNIKKVYFMKEKSLFHWWKKGLKSIQYEMNKENIPGSELQDSLFMLHPKYPEK
jgi:tRNA(Arg) A34 adenosine deaminase TadA